MKYYLIDYENVNASGLDGIEQISSDDRVVLFYTKHSSKIDLGMFNVLLNISAELTVIEVHHGKQALDIQLASYVGFLIGTEGLESEYYIISKDKGYRNIQDFWGEHRIYLNSSIRQAVHKDTKAAAALTDAAPPADALLPQTADAEDTADAGTAQSGGQEGAEAAPEAGGAAADVPAAPAEAAEEMIAAAEETAQEGADSDPEQETAETAGGSEDAGNTADDAESTVAADDISADAESSSAADTEPAAGGSEADGAKPAASRNGKRSPRQNGRQKNASIRNEVNTEIQKRLSKAGYPGDVINATASFVSRNIGRDGYKQLIYRGIIKEHGQKTGLALYRLIKEVL